MSFPSTSFFASQVEISQLPSLIQIPKLFFPLHPSFGRSGEAFSSLNWYARDRIAPRLITRCSRCYLYLSSPLFHYLVHPLFHQQSSEAVWLYDTAPLPLEQCHTSKVVCKNAKWEYGIVILNHFPSWFPPSMLDWALSSTPNLLLPLKLYKPTRVLPRVASSAWPDYPDRSEPPPSVEKLPTSQPIGQKRLCTYIQYVHT